jgi:hypothetical protein
MEKDVSLESCTKDIVKKPQKGSDEENVVYSPANLLYSGVRAFKPPVLNGLPIEGSSG